VITEEIAATETTPVPRLGRVLGQLAIAVSSWYRPSTNESLRKHPGPPVLVQREMEFPVSGVS
jgi:hypothetical protein